jgi:WD40 repeat protein
MCFKFINNCDTDIRQLSGTSTTSFPNVTCHPGGRFVLYCGTNNVTLHNTATNVRELTLMPDIGESFQTVAVSPSGTQVAIVARFYTDCVRLVTSALANTLIALRRTVNCTKICPLMRPLRDRSDRYLCTFSPDASRLLLASSHGCVVVFSWPRLAIHCLLTSGGSSERILLSTSLATERSIDFDPRMHASLCLVTLGTSDRQIYTCDVMAEGCVKHQTDLPEGGSGRGVQCVRYSTMGDQVAVALAGALVYILQPDCSTWLYCVDRTVETLGIVSPAADEEMQPATVQMAFSHADDLLAVSSTDGRVCLWQLPVDLSLKHLCRLALRQYLTYDSMAKLAIPRSIVDYLISPHTIEHKSGPSQGTQLVTWRGLLAPWM